LARYNLKIKYLKNQECSEKATKIDYAFYSLQDNFLKIFKENSYIIAFGLTNIFLT